MGSEGFNDILSQQRVSEIQSSRKWTLLTDTKGFVTLDPTTLRGRQAAVATTAKPVAHSTLILLAYFVFYNVLSLVFLSFSFNLISISFLLLFNKVNLYYYI